MVPVWLPIQIEAAGLAGLKASGSRHSIEDEIEAIETLALL